jgi:type I restriction enzyme S subunit
MSVTKDWKEKELEQLVIVDPEKLGDSTDRTFSFYYIDIGAVSEGKITLPSHKITFRESPSRARKVVHRGDVLMSTVRPNLRAFAYFDHTDDACIASTGFAILRARVETDPRFILFAILSAAVSTQIETHAVGSNYPAINSSTVSKIRILSPPFPEQIKIAEILSTVDRAIEQTEALIAKQQRIKTGLMQDLLTRGIDERGNLRSEQTHQFKDSPLGRIPVEWDVEPADWLCDAVIDCKNRTPPAASGGHPVIRTPNVRDGEFVFNDLAYTDPVSYGIWVARGKPRGGDVVITREAPFGEACLIPNNLDAPCLGQRIMMYQPNISKLRPDYMVYAICSETLQTKLLELAGGSTVGHIRVGDIRELPVPHPKSVEEQRVIAETLSAEADVIKEFEAISQKLYALKTALMQDLLTGKKRVTELLRDIKAVKHVEPKH